MLMLGGGLLLDGGLLLGLNAFGVQSAGVNAADIGVNLVHAVSGATVLAVSIGSTVRAPWAALVFGAFYVALGVVGLTIDRPFGLQLGPGENAFHLTAGLLALLLGAWALRTSAKSLTLAPSRNGALPPGLQNGPATRRRAHRRPGKGRGHQRRH